MDLTESIAARSDQINADDLVAGPATYTVREVVNGKAEQPFDFLLVETDRAYRPSKTMRRMIVAAWGPAAAAYVGRKLTLYREPTIRFGGKVVGGIRISHASAIDAPIERMLQTTRGTREKFVIDPLTDAQIVAAYKDEWRTADPDRRKVIEAEVTKLSSPDATTTPDGATA